MTNSKETTKTPELIDWEKKLPRFSLTYSDYDYADTETPESGRQPPEKPIKSIPEYSQNDEYLNDYDDYGAVVVSEPGRLTNEIEDSQNGVTREPEVSQEPFYYPEDQEDEPLFHEEEFKPSVLVKFPTPMTRLSPFFPMSKRDRGNRPYEIISLQNNWGRVTLKGERLSVGDETTLLILLDLAKKKKFKSLWTTRYEMCRIVGRARATDTYNALWASIERLAQTYVKIQLKNKDGKVEQEMGGAIIAWWQKRIKADGSERINVVLNPYFAKMVEEGRITRLNLELRNQIKTDTAKALYRFYDGQRTFYEFKKRGHPMMVLALAINLKTDGVKPYLIRKKIKAALNELERNGYLTWKIAPNDYVMVKKKR
jgi:hypothetical protein